MKRLIALLIALSALLLCSCQSGNTEVVSDVTSEETYIVPVKDMEQRTFNILCWDFSYGSNSILGYTGEVLFSDEENASSVDEAKKEIINKIEEDYNCVIDGVMMNTSSSDFQTTVRNMVTVGTQEYDILFNSIQVLSPLVSDDYLTDLTTIETIELSNPWWDQNSVADLSINNELFFVCGDINTYDDEGTWCMLFNKDLKTRLNIEEDFYQLVRDDKWTFDKFTELCKGVTYDSDGVAGLDEFDTWAFGTETYNIFVHVLSSGQKIADKDKDDLPYITVIESPEATYSALSKILEFYNQKETVMVANAAPYTQKGYANVWESTVHKAFIEGRELFYMCGLIHAASFRKMDDNFGILPIPKFNEGQDRYYHTVSVGNMTAMSIPVGVKNPDDVGIIVEALGKLSMEKLTPEFYDIQLKYRDTRDDESGEMLDLIFASRTFDLGAAFNWGSILGQYMTMDTNFVSRFEATGNTVQAALERTIEDLTD